MNGGAAVAHTPATAREARAAALVGVGGRGPRVLVFDKALIRFLMVVSLGLNWRPENEDMQRQYSGDCACGSLPASIVSETLGFQCSVWSGHVGVGGVLK